MNSKEKLKKEIVECINDAKPLILFLQGKLKKDASKNYSFAQEFQKWYSKALKVVEFLGKDRFA